MKPQSRDVAAEILTRIRRVTVILNPAAGRGQGRRQREELETLMSRAVRNLHDIVSWKIVETTGPGTGTALAQEAVDNGAQMIVAAGGDGTLGEVLNGIMNSSVKLGLLPMGTGNDFARTLGIGITLKPAVLNLFYGDPIQVDVGKVNGRYFLNVAGCGFDAACAERVNKGYRNLRGRAAYLAAVYQTLYRFHPMAMRVTLDQGETRELQAMLCAVANAQTYGGGMRVAPDAQIDDGLLDICLVTARKWEFLRAFPRVFKGTHTTHPKVEMLRASSIRIETDQAVPILVDGELFGMTPAEFTLEPGAITIMGPEKAYVSEPDRYEDQDDIDAAKPQ